MRNLLKSAWRYLALAAFVAMGGVTAFALTVPPTFAPRMFATEQVSFFRLNVTAVPLAINGQACVLASNACSVKVGAFPYNSFIKSVSIYPVAAFNSGTTDTIELGTNNTTGSNNIIVATTIHTGVGNSLATTGLAGFGLAVTGNNVAPTGANGGFDLWATYRQSGAVATAGQVIMGVDFMQPLDSTCTSVPIGSAAAAC